MKLLIFILGSLLVNAHVEAEYMDLCKNYNKKACLDSCFCNWCRDAGNKTCMSIKNAHHLCENHSSTNKLCASLDMIAIIIIVCTSIVPFLFCSTFFCITFFSIFEYSICDVLEHIYEKISFFLNDCWVKYRKKGMGEPLIYGL